MTTNYELAGKLDTETLTSFLQFKCMLAPELSILSRVDTKMHFLKFSRENAKNMRKQVDFLIFHKISFGENVSFRKNNSFREIVVRGMGHKNLIIFNKLGENIRYFRQFSRKRK
jgi:hypothetical protein